MDNDQVQAELQKYLDEKKINNLFIHIVENLLLTKPDNPIQFIVDYLFEKYPDHLRSLKVPGAAAEAPAHDPDEEDSEDEDDEDDYVDELPVIKKETLGNRRRTAVSSESFDEDEKIEVKKVDKSPEDAARILQFIRGSILFKQLDDEQLETVAQCMFPMEHKTDDIVIKQGDEGDNFYLMSHGSVAVFVRDKSGGPSDDVGMKVAEYGPGAYFGELALMYNAPRAATCKATTDIQVWCLDRMSFKALVVKSNIEKRKLHRGFVGGIPILSQLTPNELDSIADTLVEETFSSGEVICTEGDHGNAFYIVKEGVAKAFKGGVHVATLEKGGYFGEIALLTAKPRQATVKAETTLKTLSLDRKTFKRVMGPLEEILKRNMEQYNKFNAAII